MRKHFNKQKSKKTGHNTDYSREKNKANQKFVSSGWMVVCLCDFSKCSYVWIWIVQQLFNITDKIKWYIDKAKWNPIPKIKHICMESNQIKSNRTEKEWKERKRERESESEKSKTVWETKGKCRENSNKAIKCKYIQKLNAFLRIFSFVMKFNQTEKWTKLKLVRTNCECVYMLWDVCVSVCVDNVPSLV